MGEPEVKKDVAENEIKVNADVGIIERGTPGIPFNVSAGVQQELDILEGEMKGVGVVLNPKEVRIIDVSNAKGTRTLPTEWNFHVYYRDTNGILWAGNFIAKRLTNYDMGQIGVNRARFNNGLSMDSLDVFTVRLNEMLAYFRVAIKEAPEWWKPEDMYDASILDHIYEWLTKKESSFRGGVVAK